MICLHCEQTLTHSSWRGWMHPEGGLYMVVCPKCGWKGAPYPAPLACPTCGSKRLRDDHCAFAVRERTP
jgi:DNA-directed RNA polymerase subunit RPC12/RpoP